MIHWSSCSLIYSSDTYYSPLFIIQLTLLACHGLAEFTYMIHICHYLAKPTYSRQQSALLACIYLHLPITFYDTAYNWYLCIISPIREAAVAFSVRLDVVDEAARREQLWERPLRSFLLHLH